MKEIKNPKSKVRSEAKRYEEAIQSFKDAFRHSKTNYSLKYRGLTVLVEDVGTRNSRWWKYCIKELVGTEFDQVRSKTLAFDKGIKYIDLYYQHEEYVNKL